MKLIFVLLSFAIATQVSTASERSEHCAQSLNPLAGKTIGLLKKSEAIDIEYISCSKISAINDLISYKMFITSGRKGRQKLVCMSDDPSNPCKIKLGEVRSTEDPNKLLSEAFDLSNELDLTKPLEESIERLFIKPSEELFPTNSGPK